MKNLPIGIQTLPKIREKDSVYVDKTRLVHQLVTSGSYYFLSRPRRFGKSLLVSTLKELYQANQPVFADTWIYDNWDWSKKNPVLHFSFDKLGYIELGLETVLKNELRKNAETFGVTLTATDLKGMFDQLIEKTAEKHGKVVLLVDEYDKPINDFLETHAIEQAKANRDILREFYGVLKNADQHLELVFITGVSKFAKVSLFSHLNNLKDITLGKKYATLTGYTQDELETYFEDHLIQIEAKLNISRKELLTQMKIWYNGYSWDGESRVYNPFGTLNFLDDQVFQNYWFSTGSPRFLVEVMQKLTVYNVENSIVNNVVLDRYDIDNIELIPLLFQTGYLTVKESDPMTGDMVLDYPNKEVRESMYQFLIDDIAKNQHRTHTGRTVADIGKAFQTKDLEQVRNIVNSILADLPYETFEKRSEGLFHGLIHLIFSYLGVFIQSEVHSSRGRADAIVETQTDVYIFEFKFNKTAEAALEQIQKKNYAAKYRASSKAITGIGVNFDNEKKEIDAWVEVAL